MSRVREAQVIEWGWDEVLGPLLGNELMWGLVYNGLCSFAFTIKCLSSYIKMLVLSMMLFSSFSVRRRNLSPLSCPQLKKQ